jgi:hypothetical protein
MNATALSHRTTQRMSAPGRSQALMPERFKRAGRPVTAFGLALVMTLAMLGSVDLLARSEPAAAQAAAQAAQAAQADRAAALARPAADAARS